MLLKFIWKNYPLPQLQIAKAILEKKKMGGFSLPCFKLHFKSGTKTSMILE